jgi:branched-chain amino acid transport system ATP-binding protein
MALIELRNVDVAYGQAAALRQVSLQVQAGTITSVLGANGSGKTTLLRTISGLVRCRGGEISVDGKRIEDRPVHEIVRAGVSHVPEGRGLLAELTVVENLRLGAHTRGGAKGPADLDRVYSLFPILEERREQPAGMLSGGEQQMLAIARVLLAQPRLLMIDELSLGLAPRVTKMLMALLKEIRDQGVSVLLVEQNVHQALSISDEVYLLVNGEIRFRGPPQELRGRTDLMQTYLGIS